MDQKLLIKDVRGLLQLSKPSGPGGFSAWLRNRISQELFSELVDALGTRFNQLEFYEYLFPNARSTCKTPGCNETVRFDKRALKYISYCSAACSWKDPAKIETRRRNELERSGGKYTNVAQRPELRNRSRALRRSKTYKEMIMERELERSNGASIDPRSRPEAISKRVESNRRNELERSGGKRTSSSQRPEVREKLRESAHNLKIEIDDDLPVPVRVQKKALPVAPMEPVEALRARFRNAPQRLDAGGASWLVVGHQKAAIPWLLTEGIAAQSIDTSGPSYRSEGRDYEPDLWIEKRGLVIDLTSEPPRDRGELKEEIQRKARGALHKGYKYLYLAFLDGRKPAGYVHVTRERQDFRLHTNMERLSEILQQYV